MDKLLALFDLFNASAKILAGYLPQSGPQLVSLFKNLSESFLNLDAWMGNAFGVSVKIFLSAISKIAIVSGTFLLDLLKQIVGRINL